MASLNQPIILLLNLPPSSLCGIDLLSFTTSPKFQGIKEIPPGWHFIFTGVTASLSIRHGTWLKLEQRRTAPPDVVIKKWDPETESLADVRDDAEVTRLKANIGSAWSEHLAPYRQSAADTAKNRSQGVEITAGEDWHALTDCISSGLLSRITGGGWNNWSITSASSATQDLDDIPALSTQESQDHHPQQLLNFLPINLKQTWRSGAVGRERTDAAKDRSWALGDLLQNHCTHGGEAELIGEMQLTFLMVLTLANYSCMEQWKRILGLVYTCQAAVEERPGLFIRLLSLTKLQLQHCNDVEGGVFDLSDEGGAMLKGLLKTFRRGLEDVLGDEESAVRDQYDELESFVKTELGWELGDSYVRRGMVQLEDGEEVELEVDDMTGEDERGEYAPVVVDLGHESS